MADQHPTVARPTLAQVALVAGVSRSTASYALNGRKPVAQTTRERVEAAAARIGYRANAGARSLRTRSTPRIGVLLLASEYVMTTTHNSLFWPRFQNGFVQTCSDAGCVVAYAGHDRAQELIDSGIDLLGIQGIPDPGILDDLDIPFGLPLLTLAPLPGRRGTLMIHDGAEIVRTVVDHLVAQGARRIAWLPVAAVVPTLGHWRPLLAAECARRGIGFVDGMIEDDLSNMEGETRRMLDAGVDAIFAVPGSTPRLLNTIRSAGLRVPEDVMVITQAEGLLEEALTPAVTTLSLCANDSARLAAEAALRQLRSDRAENVAMPFALDVRASTSRV